MMKRFKILFIMVASLILATASLEAQKIDQSFGENDTLTNTGTLTFTMGDDIPNYDGILIYSWEYESLSGTVADTVTVETKYTEDQTVWIAVSSETVATFGLHKITQTPPQGLYYRARHRGAGTQSMIVKPTFTYKIPVNP